MVLGERGRAVVATPGPETLTDATRWRVLDVAPVGPDVRITYAPDPGGPLMFTGIVEELGTVASVTPVADGARLVIAATTVLGDARIGDSIAVNGCCLTVVELTDTPGRPTR